MVHVFTVETKKVINYSLFLVQKAKRQKKTLKRTRKFVVDGEEVTVTSVSFLYFFFINFLIYRKAILFMIILQKWKNLLKLVKLCPT